MTVADVLDLLRPFPQAHQLATTAAIAVGAYALHLLLKWYIGRLVSRPEIRQGYWGLSRNVLFFVGSALVVAVWIEELKAVSLLLTGLLAATLLVNKEVFLGLAARLTLSIVKQYDIGDRIRINTLSGDVIDIGLLHTWLMEVAYDEVEKQSTGRVAVFPHIWLTQHAVYNLTRGHQYLWDEMELAFPPDVDGAAVAALLSAEAERLLHEDIEHARRAVRRLAEQYASRNPPVTPVAYATLRQQVSGHQVLVIAVRFSVLARRRREVHSRLLLHLLQVLRERQIPLYTSLFETLPPRTRPAPPA
jgi:small-conductance mechanosensitive channel